MNKKSNENKFIYSYQINIKTNDRFRINLTKRLSIILVRILTFYSIIIIRNANTHTSNAIR